MSTVLTETRPETVFDAPPVQRIGPESNGMLMTPEEFDAIEDWDERYRYELFNGVLIVSAAPSPRERGPNAMFDYWLWRYHDDHPEGAAMDDTLPEHDLKTSIGTRRADRVIWCGLGRQPHAKNDIPSIVVELVSQDLRDRKRDYEEKRTEYAALGVKEYWIIDRFRRTMTVCRGDADLQVVQESETYTTDLLPGFELPLEKLLAVADRWESADE